MSVSSRREADDLIALVSALAGSSRGLRPIRLSADTGLARSRIVELAARHRDYVVDVGGRGVYALNRFGRFRGSAEQILEDVERAYAEYERAQQVSTVVVILSAAAAGIWLG